MSVFNSLFQGFTMSISGFLLIKEHQLKNTNTGIIRIKFFFILECYLFKLLLFI